MSEEEKKKDNLSESIATILGFFLLVGFSWIFTLGMSAAIFWCFNIPFTIKKVFGIWLIIWLLRIHMVRISK